VQHYTCTITLILLLGEIILSPYSYYAKEGLVYVTLASPLSWQPSLYLECTKLNIQLSYNIRSISNAKYLHSITLNSL
jgi:hypothetical protein